MGTPHNDHEIVGWYSAGAGLAVSLAAASTEAAAREALARLLPEGLPAPPVMAVTRLEARASELACAVTGVELAGG